jgi:AcrR family transcriptional regulator
MKFFTRYRILNSARTMVAEVGVERVTMRGIAAMANITAASSESLRDDGGAEKR